jgi:cleavage and polyadenylation specificity factor subunit 2
MKLDFTSNFFLKTKKIRILNHLLIAGKGEGIKLTALCAGHMLGGCLWKIGKDEEEIVYAVDFAHKKERLVKHSMLFSVVRLLFFGF